ncbi:MAG: RNA polymerase sporulation sigma factor SigK [Clostridiales bacterium]|nr:RNA polymerase sporulation sigma factor SigK [Clostridiales bacterium]
MFGFLVSYINWILHSGVLLLGYVKTSNSFPAPLNSDEEKKYLLLFKDGDITSKNILIEHNLRLVAHIVKKYCSNPNEIDDYISIGTIGLIKAITSFEIDKGTKLATYAARCIENEILMHIRASKKFGNDVYLEDPIGTDKDGNIIDFMEIVRCDEPDIFSKVELKLKIKNLYSKMRQILKHRERIIIELRYGLYNGNSKTQIEIANLLGISRSYVSRIEKKALNKLLRELEKE